MAKPNKNRKKFYDAYKAQGRREKNKARKAEKHEKLMAKYKARREDPDYQKARAERKAARDPRDVPAPTVRAKTYAGFASIMGKLSYLQEQEAKEAKKMKKHIEGKKQRTEGEKA